jgi:hypothetical protein
MTKYITILILAGLLFAVPPAGAFAQSKSSAPAKKAAANNAVSVDVVPFAKGLIAGDSGTDTAILGIGAVYERLIAPHYSVGARLDMYTGSNNHSGVFYLGLDAHGRYYPLSQSFEKFFFDTGLGLNTLKDKEYDNFTGLTFALKAGWKHFFDGRIFAEPSLAYVLAKSSKYFDLTPLGWQIGFNIGAIF